MAYGDEFSLTIRMDKEGKFSFRLSDSEGYNTIAERQIGLDEVLNIFDRFDAQTGTTLSQFTRTRVKSVRDDLQKQLEQAEARVAKLREQLG